MALAQCTSCPTTVEEKDITIIGHMLLCPGCASEIIRKNYPDFQDDSLTNKNKEDEDT